MVRAIAQDQKASLNFGAAGATSNVVSFPANTAMSAANLTRFTFAVWVKTRSIGGGTAGRVIDSNPFVLITQASGGRLYYSAQVSHTTTAGIMNSAIGQPFNQWTRVLYTWNDTDTTPNIYINGVLSSGSLTAKSGTRTSTSASISVGNRADLIRNFDGLIRDVCIRNRVLTAAEIAADGAGAKPPTNGLISYKKFEDGDGTVANDAVDSALNGTISGGTYSSDTPSKVRQIVGGNLVFNGDFEYAPPFTAATTTGGKWIVGTAAGSSSNNLFGWANTNYTAGATATIQNGKLTLATTGTGQSIEVGNSQDDFTVATLKRQLIPIKPSTTYTVTYKMATTYASGDSSDGAFLRVVTYGGTLGFGTRVITSGTKIKTTTAETTYSFTFTSASTAAFLLVSANIVGNTGAATLQMSATFDDITIAETVPIKRAMAQNRQLLAAPRSLAA